MNAKNTKLVNAPLARAIYQYFRIHKVIQCLSNLLGRGAILGIGDMPAKYVMSFCDFDINTGHYFLIIGTNERLTFWKLVLSG